MTRATASAAQVESEWSGCKAKMEAEISRLTEQKQKADDAAIDARIGKNSLEAELRYVEQIRNYPKEISRN